MHWLSTFLLLAVETGSAEQQACPTDAELRAALLEVGERPEQWDEYRIEFQDNGRGQDLLVVDEDGTVLAHRELTGDDCILRAKTAAVVLASIRTTLPGFDNALSLPVRAPPIPSPAPKTTVDVVALRIPPSQQLDEKKLTIDIGAAAGMSLSGSHTAPNVALSLLFDGLQALPFGVLLGMRYTGEAEADLGPGKARWDRLTGQLAPMVAGHYGWGVLRFSPSLNVSTVRVSGSGYAQDRSTSSFELGAGAGLHCVWGNGQFRPTVGLQTGGWFGNQSLSLVGTPEQSRLPRWEVIAEFGVFFNAW